jgi:hypothetical protein
MEMNFGKKHTELMKLLWFPTLNENPFLPKILLPGYYRYSGNQKYTQEWLKNLLSAPCREMAGIGSGSKTPVFQF